MEVEVLYFAIARERVGLERETIALPDGASVETLWAEIAQKHETLIKLRPHLRIAVNQAFCGMDQALKDGDEVAIIPPVAGGVDLCGLSAEPLDVAAIEALVDRPEAGAVATFRGVVRNHTGDRKVVRLEYEIYPEMALTRLRAVRAEVEEKWPTCLCAIWHRHGQLGIGDTAVFIAVSSPHRAAAFEGCRHAIERIKEDVPIWKKEIGPDGASWVGIGS